MEIENVEEAYEYIAKVETLLDKLSELSVKAGLYGHVSVWEGIHAALLHSSEEFQTIVDMMGMIYKHLKVVI